MFTTIHNYPIPVSKNTHCNELYTWLFTVCAKIQEIGKIITRYEAKQNCAKIWEGAMYHAEGERFYIHLFHLSLI